MLSKNDLAELQRITTNLYDDDKRMMQRVLNEISRMQREISLLKTENQSLKEQANKS